MSKVKMPAPVAVMWEHETDRRAPPETRIALWPPFQPLMHFDPLYTAEQMESYAAARVAEALREAVDHVEAMGEGHRAEDYSSAIRILIPPANWPA